MASLILRIMRMAVLYPTVLFSWTFWSTSTYCAASSGNSTNSKIRVEVLLLQFSNPSGINYNRKSCDVVTPCDPIILAYVDLENPEARSLDAQQDLRNFQEIKRVLDQNIVDIHSTVHKDICLPAQSNLTKTATLRVKVRDYDHTNHYDPIDNFECKISCSLSFPSDKWSETVTCKGINQPEKINITFRWRIRELPSEHCSA